MPTKPVGHAQLPMDQVHTNPDQPRKLFDPEALKALQRSLSQRGLINPISVVQRKEGGYLLIAGERRYRAAQALGWKDIEARIWPTKTPSREIELLSVVENLQRKDLNPVEEARSYKVLLDPPNNLSQQAISRIVGKARSQIGLSLSILEQPEEIQECVARATISLAHIRFLGQISDIGNRVEWARTAEKEGWSVRELDRRIKDFLGKNRAADLPLSAFPSIPDTPPVPVSQGLPDASPVVTSERSTPESRSPSAVQEMPPGSEITSYSDANATALTLASEAPLAVEKDLSAAEGTAQRQVDPLAAFWPLANELAPAGASWSASYPGQGEWNVKLGFPDADPSKVRTELARWLIAFGQRLLPEIIATTAAAPPVPQILEATYGNGHRLQLRWTPGGEGFTYRIYRAPSDSTEFERFGESDLTSPGAVLDCYGAGFTWFHLAVMAIDPQGRESELSQPVRFDLSNLNQQNAVDPLGDSPQNLKRKEPNAEG